MGREWGHLCTRAMACQSFFAVFSFKKQNNNNNFDELIVVHLNIGCRYTFFLCHGLMILTDLTVT